MTTNKSFEDLESIQNLKYNWNGNNAKPFSDKLIEKCKKIINILPIQPTIYPTERNSIQFQYELEDKSYLEFEIFEDKILCLEVPQRIYSKAIEREITNSEDILIRNIVNNFCQLKEQGNCK